MGRERGQLLIGCSLGARFVPEFFRGSLSFLICVIASVLLLLAGCAGIGFLLGWCMGMPLPTPVLATIPGLSCS